MKREGKNTFDELMKILKNNPTLFQEEQEDEEEEINDMVSNDYHIRKNFKIIIVNQTN